MQMKLIETKLEQAFTSLLAKEGYPHFLGDSLERNPKMGLAESEVLIEDDFQKIPVDSLQESGELKIKK